MTVPVGVATRGTTSARRLRRPDRWLAAAHPALLATPGLLVVDLGFGSRPVTTLELAHRLRAVNPTAQVVGLEIDPVRVTAARRALAEAGAGGDVELVVGGFELAGLRPHLVRAFNVLRQYDEAAARDASAMVVGRLAPGGLLVEGTCDEAGRLGAWLTSAAGGPRTLTLAVDLGLPPSAVAARLPKALIHHNVAGEGVHDLLTRLDRAWARAAPLSVFGPRQRFAAAVAAVRAERGPILDGPRRWRRGEVTVPWATVAPTAG